MKKILLGVLAVAGLVSCSNDEVMELNRSNDEIKFNAVVNNASRAQLIYSNSFQPDAFYLYAINDGKTYINGDQFKNQETYYVNVSGTRFWPEGFVDFYAHVNAGTNFKWTGTAAPTIEDFEVGADVASQVDLLYATNKAKKNQDKTKPTLPVPLAFHHALSQIVFKAKNTNENLYVEVSGIKVCNVVNKGTFTYPTPTDDTYHNFGTWSLTGDKVQYGVTFDPVALNGDANTLSAAVDLTSAAADYKKAMLLLPQTTTAWVPKAGEPAETQTGSYLLVDCEVYNVAGDVVDKANDVCLYNKEVAIPLKFEWEQGKRYIYTLIFNHAGYDPGVPVPALIPIEVVVSVDDFIDFPGDVNLTPDWVM